MSDRKPKPVFIDADCAKNVRQVGSCERCSRYADCLSKRLMAKPAEGNERLLAFTKRREYWLDRDGNAWTVDRYSGKRADLHPAMHGGQMRICIKGVKGLQSGLARMMYVAFVGPIPRNMNVAFVDGDKTNCALANLFLVDRTEFKRENGGKAKARPVIVTDRNGERVYKSVREAARHLDMSYQTLQDWLNRKTGWRSSVPGLKGVKIAYLREEHAALYPKFKRYNRKAWGRKKPKEAKEDDADE